MSPKMLNRVNSRLSAESKIWLSFLQAMGDYLEYFGYEMLVYAHMGRKIRIS